VRARERERERGRGWCSLPSISLFRRRRPPSDETEKKATFAAPSPPPPGTCAPFRVHLEKHLDVFYRLDATRVLSVVPKMPRRGATIELKQPPSLSDFALRSRAREGTVETASALLAWASRMAQRWTRHRGLAWDENRGHQMPRRRSKSAHSKGDFRASIDGDKAAAAAAASFSIASRIAPCFSPPLFFFRPRLTPHSIPYTIPTPLLLLPTGKRHNKTHTLCRRCGRTTFHIQKSTCSSCGYPAARIRKCELGGFDFEFRGPVCELRAGEWEEGEARRARERERDGELNCIIVAIVVRRSSFFFLLIFSLTFLPFFFFVNPDLSTTHNPFFFPQTTGPTRPSAARPRVPDACATSRTSRAAPRTASARAPRPRRRRREGGEEMRREMKEEV